MYAYALYSWWTTRGYRCVMLVIADIILNIMSLDQASGTNHIYHSGSYVNQ